MAGVATGDETTRDGMPLFSVITVCLNAEKHLAEALDSVLGQSRGDFEVVVVDGGSTDGTMEIVRGVDEAFGGRLKWLSEPDEGLYDAMNKGLRMARGEFVVYLGADDHLAPGALEAVARVAGEHPEAAIVCGAARVLGPHGDWVEAAARLVRRGMPQRAPARHQSIHVRTDALLAIGGFDTRYRIAADYDAYLRLVEKGARDVLIPDLLSEFRLGGASSTDALATARDYRDIRVAHGANPLVEGLVVWKAALGVWLHALMMRMRAGGRTRDA